MTLQPGQPDVLIITGPVGAGKSSVALEAAEILHDHGSHHAVIDMDALSWCWPRVANDPYGRRVGHRNLAHIWSEYEALNVRRLLIADVIETRRGLLHYQATLPKATFKVARLLVPEKTLQERLRGRETGTGLEWNLNRAMELEQIMNLNNLADFTINNDERPLYEVAEDLLRTGGWI